MPLRLTHILAAGLLVLSLCQCQTQPKGSPETTFRIRLSFTPDVLKTLQAEGDGINVDVYYYGLAGTQYTADADQVGRIRLGDDVFEVKPANVTLIVNGSGIDRSLLPRIIDGAPYVLISAASVGETGAAPLQITCSEYTGKISEAQLHPAEITCGPYSP